MAKQSLMTGAKAGLSGEKQILLALQTMVKNDGSALITDIYDAVEKEMAGMVLIDKERQVCGTLLTK